MPWLNPTISCICGMKLQTGCLNSIQHFLKKKLWLLSTCTHIIHSKNSHRRMQIAYYSVEWIYKITAVILLGKERRKHVECWTCIFISSCLLSLELHSFIRSVSFTLFFFFFVIAIVFMVECVQLHTVDIVEAYYHFHHKKIQLENSHSHWVKWESYIPHTLFINTQSKYDLPLIQQDIAGWGSYSTYK